MATEYSIRYRYTGQANTRGKRSVPIGRFQLSGDTGRSIGQITGIYYAHYHSSTKGYHWKLRGRLLFSDGTQLVSDSVSQYIQGNVLRYVNTFATLPTPEQLTQLTTVQTLDKNGSTGDSVSTADLYWRATSAEPMDLIVTFLEEPPTRYLPEITRFELTRVNAQGIADDEGTYIATTMKIAIGDEAGLSAGATLRVFYAADATPTTQSPYVNLTGRIDEMMSGVALNPQVITGKFDSAHIWNFAAVFTAGEESDVAADSVGAAFAALHISGCSTGGVSIGGFSRSTEGNPLFEVNHPSKFYGGIHGVNIYELAEVNTGGKWIDGKPIWRRVFTGTTRLSGAQGVFASLPAAPETVVSMRAMVGANGNWRPLPNTYYGDIEWSCSVFIQGADVHLGFGSRWAGERTVIVVVDYTKS